MCGGRSCVVFLFFLVVPSKVLVYVDQFVTCARCQLVRSQFDHHWPAACGESFISFVMYVLNLNFCSSRFDSSTMNARNIECRLWSTYRISVSQEAQVRSRVLYSQVTLLRCYFLYRRLHIGSFVYISSIMVIYLNISSNNVGFIEVNDVKDRLLYCCASFE
jgi:hypothetical protein